MQASANKAWQISLNFFIPGFNPISAAKKTRKTCGFVERSIETVNEYMLDVEIILSYTNQF